jgi:predicted nucleic acid-binding protein
MAQRRRELIVVDTSVWISFFRQHDTWQVHMLRHLPAASIVVGDVVLLEILQGMNTEAGASRKARDLQALTSAHMMSPGSAIRSAQNYRQLRRLGVTVRSTVDTIVATYCIDRGYPLLHQDRDFDAFEEHLGLDVLHP